MDDEQKRKVIALRQEMRRLRQLSKGDAESAHSQADKALIAFVGDPIVKREWDAMKRWYA